jgi:flagellar hook-length control protein FliK
LKAKADGWLGAWDWGQTKSFETDMSQTNIDYLFQVTGVDRAFALSRSDEQRPPFGDLLSLASGSRVAEPSRSAGREDDGNTSAANRPSSSTSGDASQQRVDMTASETSTATGAADDAQAAYDPSDDNRSKVEAAEDARKVVAEPDTSAESLAEDNEDAVADDESNLVAAAAAGQASTVNQSKATASAEGIEEVASENDAARALSTAEKNGAKSDQENGARNAASVNTITETSDAAASTQQNVDGAALPAGATNDVKKSRSAQASRNSADGKADEHQKLGAEARVEGQANGEAVTNAVTLNVDAPIEQASTEPSAGGDEQAMADESKGAKNDPTNSRQRADLTAVANKIVAAAVNGAAQASGGAADEVSDDGKRVAKPQAAKSDSLTAAAERLHSPHASGKRGARTSGEGDMPHVDPARFVGRVAKAFQTAHERGGTLQLRLAPPELGTLRLELTVKDGVMSASLETENQTARRVLLDHLPALRERLAEQNIRVERFDVDVRREGGGQEPAPQNPERQRQNQPESRRQPPSQPRTDDAARPERPIIQPMSNTPGINLVA